MNGTKVEGGKEQRNATHVTEHLARRNFWPKRKREAITGKEGDTSQRWERPSALLERIRVVQGGRAAERLLNEPSRHGRSRRMENRTTATQWVLEGTKLAVSVFLAES